MGFHMAATDPFFFSWLKEHDDNNDDNALIAEWSVVNTMDSALAFHLFGPGSIPVSRRLMLVLALLRGFFSPDNPVSLPPYEATTV